MTVRRNSPRSSQTVGVPKTKTVVPSAGGALCFDALARHITERIWACASTSEKYQCPLW